jgi:zinc protease
LIKEDSVHRAFAAALLLALLIPLAPASANAQLDGPLPTDSRLVVGQLPNGLRYVIRRHPTAERRVGMWLHVASGSLNETESTRGLAHYLEHMAFRGTANFPPGSLIPFFESIGLTFGRDQNAFTSFDQTTYQITVPAGSADALQKAVVYMADIAFRMDLSTAEIDQERGVILEEKRYRASAAQRTQDHVYERLAPESTLGRRLPIGTEEAIRAVKREDFLDYYRRWYVPGNMTLIVVGDCDPAEVTALITREFGPAPAAAVSAPLPVGLKATAGTRAIVASDPELTRAEVSLVRVEPPLPPSTTVADFRRNLVEAIAATILSRRLEDAASDGTVKFETADAFIRQWSAVRFVSFRAFGQPPHWREMLQEIGLAAQRARVHGFSDRELQDTRAALLAEARDAVTRDATAALRPILAGINEVVTRREPIMSAAQRLALFEALLPGITASEVSKAFAAAFDPANVLVIAKVPTSAGVPDEPELQKLGRAALDVQPSAVAERPRPTSLLSSVPAEARIVGQEMDPGSNVTSVWLENGVRVHHRFMDQRKGEVVINITIAGGAIEESGATRGLTEAAAGTAWSRPATSQLRSTDIRDLLLGKRVNVDPNVGEDAVTVTVRTTPGDVEAALQLVYLMLTDPRVEPVALERWRETQLDRIVRRRVEPVQAMQHLAAEALVPAAEARMRPLGTAEVSAVTAAATQEWLKRVVASAPIEVAIVGDLPEGEAVRLASIYLGGLPARERIADTTFENLRRVTPPPGPIRARQAIDTRTFQAAVLAGFRGADLRNLEDARLMSLAARVMSSRMLRALREERQFVYSIYAFSRPGVAYPGFGAFLAQAPTDPTRAEALAREIEAMYAHFAKEGPTENEVAIARRQVVALLDQQLQQPDFWAGRLGSSEYRGQTTREPLEGREQYATATASQILDAFRRYWRPESSFSIVITPSEPPAAVNPVTPPAAAPAKPGS